MWKIINPANFLPIDLVPLSTESTFRRILNL
jgi:hypothetical protein